MESHFGREVDRDALNHLRAERGWTIPDLAAHSGVSVSMLTKMLCGRRDCSLITANKVARAIGCTPEDFTRPAQGRTSTAA